MMQIKFLIFIITILLLFLALPKIVMIGLGIVLGLLLSTIFKNWRKRLWNF